MPPAGTACRRARRVVPARSATRLRAGDGAHPDWEPHDSGLPASGRRQRPIVRGHLHDDGGRHELYRIQSPPLASQYRLRTYTATIRQSGVRLTVGLSDAPFLPGSDGFSGIATPTGADVQLRSFYDPYYLPSLPAATRCRRTARRWHLSRGQRAGQADRHAGSRIGHPGAMRLFASRDCKHGAFLAAVPSRGSR